MTKVNYGYGNYIVDVYSKNKATVTYSGVNPYDKNQCFQREIIGGELVKLSQNMFSTNLLWT
jgi:hypothetical protein